MNNPRLKLPLVLIAALVLHTAVMGHVRVDGVAPDLMLTVAIAVAFVRGPEAGAILGFLTGLAVDLVVNTTPLGLSALAFTLVGYTVGAIQGGILRPAWWIPLMTAFVASASGEALYALSGALVGQTQLVTARSGTIVLLVGALNAVLLPVVLRTVRWALAGDDSPATRARARARARAYS
ncbi:MAG: rod shape-determining protein MreD [Acidimicrobiales bacterium]